ncbi:mavicyanin-like [Zingiber officinale]|uniref:mavicyanin-like n=1 Tax=Zingiber officinale TaxID=94328 RepID=UPI001C4BE941|nr:mavicyanin-like [Zingiber officinale]
MDKTGINVENTEALSHTIEAGIGEWIQRSEDEEEKINGMSLVSRSASRTTHSVGIYKGDSNGWNLNVNDQWTTTKPSFPAISSSSSLHNVVEVNSSGYSSCSSGSPNTMDNSGNTAVALPKVGTQYFICGISNDC